MQASFGSSVTGRGLGKSGLPQRRAAWRPFAGGRAGRECRGPHTVWAPGTVVIRTPARHESQRPSLLAVAWSARRRRGRPCRRTGAARARRCAALGRVARPAPPGPTGSLHFARPPACRPPCGAARSAPRGPARSPLPNPIAPPKPPRPAPLSPPPPPAQHPGHRRHRHAGPPGRPQGAGRGLRRALHRAAAPEPGGLPARLGRDDRAGARARALARRSGEASLLDSWGPLPMILGRGRALRCAPRGRRRRQSAPRARPRQSAFPPVKHAPLRLRLRPTTPPPRPT
jgi:hypothetical protein